MLFPEDDSGAALPPETHVVSGFGEGNALTRKWQAGLGQWPVAALAMTNEAVTNPELLGGWKITDADSNGFNARSQDGNSIHQRGVHIDNGRVSILTALRHQNGSVIFLVFHLP